MCCEAGQKKVQDNRALCCQNSISICLLSLGFKLGRPDEKWFLSDARRLNFSTDDFDKTKCMDMTRTDETCQRENSLPIYHISCLAFWKGYAKRI